MTNKQKGKKERSNEQERERKRVDWSKMSAGKKGRAEGRKRSRESMCKLFLLSF